MILVDGKLFAIADRGGVAFSKELVRDFLGSKLIALDPADGTELWSTDMNHIDQLGADVPKVAEDLKEINEKWPHCYSAFLTFRQVAGPLLGGGHGQPNYAGEGA